MKDKKSEGEQQRGELAAEVSWGHGMAYISAQCEVFINDVIRSFQTCLREKSYS